MQVHRSTEELPHFTNAVLTIGSFDGVHAGHQKIISELKREAEKIGGESIIITFDPHPRKVVQPSKPLQLITTLDEKIDLLQQAGIDQVVIVPFTQTFSQQSAEDYLHDFLIGKFHPHTIIIGYDHHFGASRKGNFQFLEKKASQYNYKLIEIPAHILNEIEVSSTQIRTAITNSDAEKANSLLGYSFFFSGEVVRGDQLGRKLGYPTANLQHLDVDKIKLGHGVYAAQVNVRGERKGGMLSIGNRPTLTGSGERVEVNIFDFDQEIYGETIQVSVVKYLRAQEKYNSLDDLVAQLHKDKEDSLRILG